MSDLLFTTKQLLILQALTAQIELVNPDTTFPGLDGPPFVGLDLRGKVYRGRPVFGKDDVPPFVSILEAPRPATDIEADEAKTFRNTDWNLLVQGFSVDDKTNPTDPAYLLKAAVEMVLARIVAVGRNGMALYPTENLLGKHIITAKIGPGVVRPPGESSPTAFFYLPVTLQFAEDLTAAIVFPPPS